MTEPVTVLPLKAFRRLAICYGCTALWANARGSWAMLGAAAMVARDRDPVLGAEGALTVGGGVGSAKEGQLDHAEDWPVVFNQGKGNGAQRQRVGEVDRAVDRIQRPVPLTGPDHAFLFAEEADVWC